MRKTRLLFLLLATILLQSCSSLPSPQEMAAEIKDYKLPQQPQEHNTLVYVVRPSSLGGLIRFNVFLDGRDDEDEMGFNRGSQYIYFFVKPGKHIISSKAENWDTIKIKAKRGDVVYIQQSTEMGFIMARNTLNQLSETIGKYHIKNTSSGKLTISFIFSTAKSNCFGVI